MSTPALGKLFVAMQSSKGFPTLERTATAVLGALNGAARNPPDVVSHIIEDFALTQKVLKLANSSMYAPFAKGSASVSSAMQVLGSDALLHLVLGTSLITDDELHADETLSRTLLACEFSRSALAERAEDASVATLMYNLGKLIVERYLPQEMAAIKEQVIGGAADEDAAQAVLEMSFQQVGVEVAKHWNLPTAVLSSMDGTGDPALVGVARFSNDASALLREGKLDDLERLVERLDVAGIDKSKLATLVKQKTRATAPIENSGTMLPVENSLGDLYAVLTRQPFNSVEELANSIFPMFGRSLNATHCLLFILTRSGEFAIRHGYGNGLDSLKSNLKIAAEFKPTAFHAVIKKNVDVSIEDVSKLKPASLPEGFRELLPATSKFVILPIAHSRVTGLLYFDWDSEKALGLAEMEAAKKLRDLFLPFFPR